MLLDRKKSQFFLVKSKSKHDVHYRDIRLLSNKIANGPTKNAKKSVC